MKKSMKKYISFLLSVLLITSLLLSPVFSSQGNTKVAEAATISIKAKLTTLEVGSTTTLTISGSKKKVTWSTSNKKIAKVDTKGKVTAVAIGSATITASVSGKKIKRKITVVEQTMLSNSAITLNVGKKNFIRVKGKNTAKINNSTWSTSDKNIATVDSKGNITAKKIGTAVITASINGKKYNCKVTVIEKIALVETKINLQQGVSKPLTFKGIKYRAVWTSSNPNVAYVSFDGKVTGISAGTAIITGRVDGINYTSNVTVTNVTGITQGGVFDYVGNKTKTLLAPTGVNGPFSWTSDNASVIDVNDAGTLNIKAAGQAKITASNGVSNYTYYVVGINNANPYLNTNLFKAKEVVFNKLHFVVPADWEVIDTSKNGAYSVSFNIGDSENTVLNIEISKTKTQAPEYFTTKSEILAMNPEYYMKQWFGPLLTAFKQVDAVYSFGNVLKTYLSVNLSGETINETDYSFALDQYEATISGADGGDTPNFQKIVDYIVNSVYVQ